MPLACGGPDAVSNLQWQTIRDVKAKDKGDEGLHSVGVTPPFPGTLAGYFLTRPELLRPSIARRRWIIWRRWWIDRRCLRAVQLLSVQLSGDVAA